MKKTSFTKMLLPGRAFLSLMLLVLSYHSATAQAMACNDLVQVSVDATPLNCQAILTADMILEGTPVPGHNYSISIHQGLVLIASGTNQITITGASQYFGYTLVATITDQTTGNSCWGFMNIEDKLPPLITCTDITVNCSENLNNIPPPTAIDNCDATPTVQLNGETVNTNTICPNGYATIVRTYVAFDDYGNTSPPCTRTIFVQRPTVIDFPNDIIWTCEQYSAFPNIVQANPLHPYVSDSNPATNSVIDVNLNPGCDDSDQPGTDDPNTNSTNMANGGQGCPGNGLDDADVLALTGSGIVSNIAGQYCNYQSSYANQTLVTCGNTFKIIRTWTVLNWCTGTIVTSGVGGEDNVQVIKVMDNVAPYIERAPFSVSANLPAQHPQVCKSTGFLLPPQVVSDNCNTVTIKILTPVGEAIYLNGNPASGGFIPPPGLPLGTHNVTYQATDACGNQTNLVVPVTVTDNVAPTAICDEITDVNIATTGTATVFAQTFDDGSHDNCCLDNNFKVRRMEDPCEDGHDDTVFGPSVVFCCEDVGTTAIVVFRVFDCFGNYNDCMVQVNVNDKIPPTIVNCPSNQRVVCDWYASNLETQLANAGSVAAQNQILTQHFGTASFYDNCNLTITPGININIDQCLEGTITRTWTAKDDSNNSSGTTCTQTIFIDHVSNWVVEFPADITVTCGNTVPDFGEPKIFFETCELVAVSYEDQVFTVVPDACFKIARRWTIINWCVVGSVIDQEVVEQPENQLGLPFPQCDLDNDGDCDSRTFRDSWRGSAPVPNPFAPNGYRLRPGAGDATVNVNPDTDLDSDPWDGYVFYEQIIKVIDNVDPIFTNGCQVPNVCINGNSCSDTVFLPVPDIQDCSPNLTITATGSLGSGLGPFLNISPGTYNVTYNVVDNCNNQTACNTTVTVVDCKKPTPYCKNGLIVELMVTTPPMVQVWAVDLNAGSFDNCPGQLKYSFSSDVNNVGQVFDCDDLGQVPVQMWVTDAAGNQDYCETFIVIQANMGQCPNGNLTANIAGAISNEENETVEGVNVNLSGESTGSFSTGNNGIFSFTNIPFGNDLTVTPEKNDQPLNGVSTYDMVLISKHVLGIDTLDSPFKLIAADANKSNSVTTADLVEIRKLILQIIPHFTYAPSWRFVDKDYVFPDPANPWVDQFPEVVNINDIPGNVLNADFVAVKTGDVNGSAVANLTGYNDDRNATGTLVLTADDKVVNAGEEVVVNFKANTLDLQGCQFTMNFDKKALQFIELLPGVARLENFGLTLLDKGVVTASWNGEAENNAMFGMVFLASQSGRLSELLSLNSRFTAAEAYNKYGDLLDVQLSFNGKAANGFELYQNMPNPFKSQTVIGFNLPESGAAKLTITDISGKVLNVIDRECVKGYNEVKINRNELPASGVLYYTLETATDTATKKMIIVE